MVSKHLVLNLPIQCALLTSLSVGLPALGVEPWTFEQKLGDAVLIPAGCPHQVRNLKV